jgi:hypothetical protein
MKFVPRFWRWLSLVASCGVLALAGTALAAPPVVSTVPMNPNNPLVFHDIISGNPTTLKGAVDVGSIGATWTWDPGDGGASVTDTVDPLPGSTFQTDDVGFYPPHAIWIEHTYTGSPGDVFFATLTVDNGVDAPESATYRMEIRDNVLDVEVNAAIDEALWHMHRNQFRFDGTPTGGTGGAIPMTRWDYPQVSGQAEVTATAASINAFEANGYLETGPADSPYSETVARGLAYVISRLATAAIGLQPAGDPDSNGNGLGIGVIGTVHVALTDHANYKIGMVMDAIVASGTPGAVAISGPAGVIGETYGDIIQDMVDYEAWGQNDPASGAARGGWDYGPNAGFGGLDNSVHGWVAIGLIAAEDIFGSTVPAFVKTENEIALEASDQESDVSNNDGVHGYRSTSPLWGPYATTGAALIQMSMDAIDSTTSGTPDERWIRSENFFRRNYNTIGGGGGSGSQFKSYYYGMFNFTKAMRTAVPTPVEIIGTELGAAEGGVGCGPNPGCAAAGPQPLDWYGDPVDGLARRIVDLQVTTGVNIGQFSSLPGGSSAQDDHDTPWGTQILTRALFQASPVAQADASPNPGAVGQLITLDGTGSFHQDPARTIVLYEWDVDADGVFDLVGPVVNTSFPALGDFPVTLRVTDDNAPALIDTDTVIVQITIPPHAPTADAGGPYKICLGDPLNLNGSGSFDVDEGDSESGNPPLDTITAWDWEIDFAPLDFADLAGPNPSTNFFNALGTFDLALRVTDNTAAAFPSAASPDLTDEDFTTVEVVPADDPFCVSLCDVDGDGDVDVNDTEAIFDARGTNASGPDDPMDANGDGFITINDGRICVLEWPAPVA